MQEGKIVEILFWVVEMLRMTADDDVDDDVDDDDDVSDIDKGVF